MNTFKHRDTNQFSSMLVSLEKQKGPLKKLEIVEECNDKVMYHH